MFNHNGITSDAVGKVLVANLRGHRRTGQQGTVHVNKKTFSALKASAAPLVIGMALISTVASAQDTTSAPAEAVDCDVQSNDPSCDSGKVIVVTGSILRRTDTETPSPVTTLSNENLDKRGLFTVQDGLQSLAANNGPALTNSFSANGAFAAGASAISLRGLSTNSTLVLFDGMRAAYYPLADDGTRNFVDLNTIPDDIVERVEILRDGASSAYGADAIAGVVNVITKRQVKGLTARAEAGLASRGDASQYRISVTGGVGDIEENGYNAYLSGFYYKSNKLMNRDRGYPFNTDNETNVCSPDGSQCGPDLRVNAPDGVFPGTAANLIVRPYDATNTTAQGRFQNLGTNGCDLGTPYTLTDDQFANNPSSPRTVCTLDYTNLYGTITPEIERWGVSGRVTAAVTDSIEAYAEFNFLQSTVNYTSNPAVLRGNAPTGILFPQFSTSSTGGALAPGSFALSLPVYVCANGTPDARGVNTGCNAANGTLNPNNPFAANGQTARIAGRILDRVTYNETRTRAYRGAVGVSGDINDNVSFNVGATAMHMDLRRLQQGYVHINNLLTSIARGTFNFVNTSQNTQAQWDYLMPDNVNNASSDQVQFDANLQSSVFDLPGGPLSVAIGGSVRYEGVDSPSGNPDTFGPTQRYFTLNAFGTQGSRWVYSAYGEVEAPIIDQVSVNASGRYDKYSSGQESFSPKIGVKFQPVRSLLIRGTFSKGFRIPSFGEANALPTTGYVNNTGGLFNNAYLNQYTVPGNTAGPDGAFAQCTSANFTSAACPVYLRSASYGQTTLASPNLKPEKSQSFTAGVFFEPTRGISFAVDYYNIKKTGVITQLSNTPALLAYYSGQAIPAGYNVIPDAVDPAFPNARPRVAFVQSQLVNANTQRVSGLDFSIDTDVNLTDSIRWNSHLEASYIIKLETEFPDGSVERYDGTAGNYNLTAGSGTSKWKGYWLNSLGFGENFELSGTLNYFGGYDYSAMDQATGYKDCSLISGVPGDPAYSPSGCQVDAYITFDIQAKVRVNDKFTLTATMMNAFDNMPPVEVATYGAHLYNPVQGGNGIYGRYFRLGAKVDF